MGILVLLGAAAVLIPVSMSIRAKDSRDGDVERMRKLYLSLAIYESQSDGQMPSTLDQARYVLPEPGILLSDADPFLSAPSPFPVDAGLPDFRRSASSRISFTYVFAYKAAKAADVPDWSELKYQETKGFLANEWQGTIKTEGDFKARVSGPLLRLNTNGALVTKDRPSPVEIGDYKSLFEDSNPPK